VAANLQTNGKLPVTAPAPNDTKGLDTKHQL
jgi:hypothetical protein